jgi:hypothetical protein
MMKFMNSAVWGFIQLTLGGLAIVRLFGISEYIAIFVFVLGVIKLEEWSKR